MKRFLKGMIYGLIWCTLWFSCKKDVNRNFVEQHSPVANAGVDQTISLPTSSVSLDGSQSSDPDNNIIIYNWVKISGPMPCSISQPSSAKTEVTNLAEGVYQFELTVKNRSGLASKDTVLISVLGIIILKSFTEEFDTVFRLGSKGWLIKDNSFGVSATWVQGKLGYDKTGKKYGFPAYSFTTSQDEFIYASIISAYVGNSYTINSWLITPTLSVKNGDKISFYSRSDSGLYGDRLQVLLSPSAGNSVGASYKETGDFTVPL